MFWLQKQRSVKAQEQSTQSRLLHPNTLRRAHKADFPPKRRVARADNSTCAPTDPLVRPFFQSKQTSWGFIPTMQFIYVCFYTWFWPKNIVFFSCNFILTCKSFELEGELQFGIKKQNTVSLCPVEMPG